MVPEARIELAPSQGGLDFESSASTYFTTPANYSLRSLKFCKDFISKLWNVVNKID